MGGLPVLTNYNVVETAMYLVVACLNSVGFSQLAVILFYFYVSLSTRQFIAMSQPPRFLL